MAGQRHAYQQIRTLAPAESLIVARVAARHAEEHVTILVAALHEVEDATLLNLSSRRQRRMIRNIATADSLDTWLPVRMTSPSVGTRKLHEPDLHKHGLLV